MTRSSILALAATSALCSWALTTVRPQVRDSVSVHAVVASMSYRPSTEEGHHGMLLELDRGAIGQWYHPSLWQFEPAQFVNELAETLESQRGLSPAFAAVLDERLASKYTAVIRSNPLAIWGYSEAMTVSFNNSRDWQMDLALEGRDRLYAILSDSVRPGWASDRAWRFIKSAALLDGIQLVNSAGGIAPSREIRHRWDAEKRKLTALAAQTVQIEDFAETDPFSETFYPAALGSIKRIYEMEKLRTHNAN